jgi:hypothetical protein
MLLRINGFPLAATNLSCDLMLKDWDNKMHTIELNSENRFFHLPEISQRIVLSCRIIML